MESRMESLLFEGKSQNKKGCSKTINQSAQPLFLQLFKIWRERVGIEPTQRNSRYAATDLKSAAATRHASAPAKSSSEYAEI